MLWVTKYSDSLLLCWGARRDSRILNAFGTDFKKIWCNLLCNLPDQPSQKGDIMSLPKGMETLSVCVTTTYERVWKVNIRSCTSLYLGVRSKRSDSWLGTMSWKGKKKISPGKKLESLALISYYCWDILSRVP